MNWNKKDNTEKKKILEMRRIVRYKVSLHRRVSRNGKVYLFYKSTKREGDKNGQ
jgi:hypothetical protein